MSWQLRRSFSYSIFRLGNIRFEYGRDTGLLGFKLDTMRYNFLKNKPVVIEQAAIDP
jgi:hypothetical protein